MPDTPVSFIYDVSLLWKLSNNAFFCFLQFNNLLIHLRTLPPLLSQLNFFKSVWRRTLLNAFWKSKKLYQLDYHYLYVSRTLIDDSVTKVIPIPLSYAIFIHTFTSPSHKVSFLTRDDSLLGYSFSVFAQSSLKNQGHFNHLPVVRQF